MALDRHESMYAPADCAMLTVSGEPHDQSVYLRLQGELDMATSPVLEAWLLEAERETTDVVIDLEDVTFIDSKGLRVFHRAADRAAEAGRGFSLCKVPGSVRRMFQLTNSTHLLSPTPISVEVTASTGLPSSSSRTEPSP